MSRERDAHRDEMLEGVIDATLRGDAEEATHFNELYEYADGEGVEVGRRGKRVKIQFGGKGGRAEWRRTEVICPDCGRHLESEGMRFLASPDDPHYDLLKEHETPEAEKRTLLFMHRILWPGQPVTAVCPAWKWRARAYRAVHQNKVSWRIRGLFGLSGVAWRNLSHNVWWERWAAKAVFGWGHFCERNEDRVRRVVGVFEQRAWEHRGAKARAEGGQQ